MHLTPPRTIDDAIRRRLEDLAAQGLYRELRQLDSPQGPRVVVEDRELINFSSNDYLGLANHPAVIEAAVTATRQWGAGAGASRLICGSLGLHHELEEALADFKGTQGAVAFSTGYAAALGAITAILDGKGVIVVDKLVHACIVDAARLSLARLRVFHHNDLEDLERILQWAAAKRAAPVLIVTETVFSMDGDFAPLRELVQLKERYGAWLMVDEAHATGLFGAGGRGLAHELGVADGIDVHMGTLGKALGASGGFICVSRALAELLINRARSFIFSTAPVPAAAGAAVAAVRLVASSEGDRRRMLLWDNVRAVRKLISQTPSSDARLSAIIPLVLGDENRAMAASAALRTKGIFIPAVRYPTVPRGKARLRLTLSASHSAADVRELGAVLELVQLEALKSPGSTLKPHTRLHASTGTS